jgi:signal transduction histidine kinase
VLENVARHGGGEAIVSCRKAGDRIRISVADHGPGMSPEHRARAFDRFFRADQARTHTGGAGLGLSLARSLVESRGGRMWLSETPGGGLTTVIDLPANANGREAEGIPG